MEAEVNAIDEKKAAEKAGKVAFDVGDYKGFFYAVLWSLIGLLGVSYIGSSVLTVLSLNKMEVDALFPTDMSKKPYYFSPSDAARAMNDHSEFTSRDLIEYIYPMDSPAFPYYSWFLPVNSPPECRDTVSFVLAKWYALTCAGSFAMLRKVMIFITIFGIWMLRSFPWVADFFLFYIYPYMLYYIVMLPFIPVLGYVFAIVSSVVNNIPGGWVLTFAPMMGVIAGIANLFQAGIFNVYSWALSMMLGFGGFALGFVNFFWWWIVGTALWIYAIGFMFLSPTMVVNGFSKAFQQFKNHKTSLVVVSIILVVQCAFSFLAPQVATGLLLGALFCFYKIWRAYRAQA